MRDVHNFERILLNKIFQLDNRVNSPLSSPLRLSSLFMCGDTNTHAHTNTSKKSDLCKKYKNQKVQISTIDTDMIHRAVRYDSLRRTTMTGHRKNRAKFAAVNFLSESSVSHNAQCLSAADKNRIYSVFPSLT